MLLSLIMVIISQCILTPNHQVVYLTYVQFSLVNFTSIKGKNKVFISFQWLKTSQIYYLTSSVSIVWAQLNSPLLRFPIEEIKIISWDWGLIWSSGSSSKLTGCWQKFVFFCSQETEALSSLRATPFPATGSSLTQQFVSSKPTGVYLLLLLYPSLLSSLNSKSFYKKLTSHQVRPSQDNLPLYVSISRLYRRLYIHMLASSDIHVTHSHIRTLAVAGWSRRGLVWAGWME